MAVNMTPILVNNKDYQQFAMALAGRLRKLLPGASGGARLVMGFGVMVLSLALAQLTWRSVPQHDIDGFLPPKTALQGATAATPSIASLTESHLFGLPQALPGSAINAPETTLNLSLRGIIAVGKGRALAIIANGADEQPYKVGDSLPAGAMVHEILADRVILERSGRFETLTLPKESLENGAAPGVLHGVAVPTAGLSAPGAKLGEIRNRLRNNPAEVVGLNALQPVMENGQIKGYQLGDSPYTPVLREAGLSPGDVVTRVNGISVTDQARAAEIFNQLSTAGRIDLEVERGGAPMALSVDLSK